MSKDGYMFSESVKGAKEELKEYILNDKGYKETYDSDNNLVS